MLTQTLIDKKEISPILVKLLYLFYKLGDNSNDQDDRKDLIADPEWETIKELFNREGYDKYLSQEYAEQLDSLSMNSTGEHLNPIAFLSSDYLKSIEESNVNRHLASALLLLMQGDIDDQLFTGFVEIIVQLIPEMIEAGDYRNLCTIYKILEKHLSEFKRPDASSALDKAIKSFSKDSITTRLAKIYEDQGDRHQPDLEELILLTGTSNLPWLIEQYLKQTDAAMTKNKFGIISKFGSQASRMAISKLPGNDARQTMMLLQLIQICRGVIPTLEISKLLQSKTIEVSCEAIKTLLCLRDDTAVPVLWKMINSKDDHLFNPAIKIIHDFKLKELVVKLPQIIKTFYITGATLERNKVILKLLGKFGHTAVILPLNKIATTKASITPANLRQTQEYLYRTLAGYPESSINELIHKGLRSRNKQISIICRELLEMRQLPVIN
ncbi:MAG: hypothetical protein FJ152_06035 [Firmicutes bacterium]|nr:hypothetical protein [Bacillota bacterium]